MAKVDRIEKLEPKIEEEGKGIGNAEIWSRTRPRSSSGGSTSESEDEQAVQTWARRLARRSRHRVKRFAEEALAIRASGLSLLEKRAVKPEAHRAYQCAVAAFENWTGRRATTFGDLELDGRLTDYMEHLFFRGEDPSRGMKLLAGVQHVVPKFGRTGTSSLHRSWRALRGWRKTCPARTRSPECLELWAAVINALVLRGRVDVAMFVALSVSSYLRPCSLLALRPEWILRPSAMEFWSLLVDPPEGGRPSKTGEWDTSVVLDSPWLLFLGPNLEKMKMTAAAGKSVWSFGYGIYLEEFKKAAATLGMTDLTPYQTRHSGASIDRARSWRDLASVKKRGGWKSDRSMARYEESARLNFQAEKRGVQLISFGRACLEELEDILLRGRPLPIPRGVGES